MAIRCHHLYMSYVNTVLNDINVNGFGFIVSNIHGRGEFRVHFTRSTCNAHNKPKEFGRCVCVATQLFARSFVRPSLEFLPHHCHHLLDSSTSYFVCVKLNRSLSPVRSLTFPFGAQIHIARASAFLCVCTRRRSPSPTVKSNSGGKHL